MHAAVPLGCEERSMPIVRTIEEKLQAPKTFRELFTPLQEAFAEGGESPDSLDQTFEQLREIIWQSRRAKAS